MIGGLHACFRLYEEHKGGKHFPVSCSVDAKSGDLAVSNIETNDHGLQGNVAIYARA